MHSMYLFPKLKILLTMFEILQKQVFKKFFVRKYANMVGRLFRITNVSHEIYLRDNLYLMNSLFNILLYNYSNNRPVAFDIN